MKRSLFILLAATLFGSFLSALNADAPHSSAVCDWQKVVVPSVREAARKFANPPAEYGLTMWWFWNGEMTDANIRRDLADLKAHGVRSVMLWCYNGLTNLEYLSPAWFERVKFAVQEARRVGVKVWIADEGCYPSGFIGGKVSRERPQQRMQILTAKKTPAGQVEVKPEYRTSATRYIHTPGFRKDETCSLFDALDPVATGDFLKDVHEQYRRHIGGEFGRTVLGFMGDEPSFPGVPYTKGIFEEFERRKGYDVRPHLPKLFAKEPRDEDRRIRADYWDVWSDLYRDNFFKPQADWCARHGMEFQMHLCGEEDMKTLVALNGDYFKCMRPVQVPGVDAIWRQIWPDKVADYAKLASSVAHVWGRPRAFSEGYAVYGRGLSVEQAKWVLDHHLARGINLFETMSYLSSRDTFRPYFCPPDLNLSPQWPQFATLHAYANRMSYLLSVGRPTANIALYYPTTSGWLGDFAPNEVTLAIAQRLLENQRDFDFVDEQALQSGLKIEAAVLVNQSGQHYHTVIVPPVKVISEAALARLEAFAKAGGKVVFVKQWPELVARKTYLHAAKGPAQLAWAALVAETDLLGLLPPADLKLSAACPAVKHVHRHLADGEVYFLFNESDRALDLTASLQGAGAPEYWDAVTGKRARATAWSRQGNGVRLSLTLEPYEARTIVLSPVASQATEARPVLKPTGDGIAIEGDWKLTIGGKEFRGPLKTWADYGEPGYCGTVRYTKEFNVPRGFADSKRGLHLDLGEVKYSARVRLNGKDLGTLAWRSFRWPIGDSIRAGVNVLEIEVTNTAANELAGNPERLSELEKKGWLLNSYVKRYLPFDKEMVPSGLLGPVRLARYETCAGNADDRLGELITIPAGGFLMGNNGREGFGGPEEFPQHRVSLPTYQIGKYEVTRGQYRRFIEAGGYDNPRYWSPEGWKWKEGDDLIYTGMHGKFRRVARPDNAGKRREPEHWTAEQEWIGHGHGHPRFTQTDKHPVVGVTYYEAEAYCKWAGGRLPTEAEWEKAARWDEKKQHARTWPWGDTWDPEKSNNAADHNPAGGGYKVNQSAPVGSYPDGASPYGCMDMVGNAWEWVADRSKSYPGNPKPYDHGDAYRLVKGGCWDDGPNGVRCSCRIWYLPPGSSGTGATDSDYIGFRVAR